MLGFNSVQTTISVRAEEELNLPVHYIEYIIVYNVLLIIGFLVLVPVLLTAWLSPRVQRASTWFPFMVSWLVISVCYSLLMGQQAGPPPNPNLCLAQVALIYAAPSFAASTAVSFLCQVFLGFYSVVKSGEKSRMAKSPLFFIFPPIVFLISMIYVLVYGAQHPEQVQRSLSGMYCHITGGQPTIISSALVIVATTLVTLLEVATAVLFYRNRVAFRRLQPSDNSLSLSVLVRVGVFTFLPFFIFAISLMALHQKITESDQQLNITIAMVPLLAGLVFGTQKDVLSALFPCIQRSCAKRSMSERKMIRSMSAV